jgi:hypothetical protein
MTSVSCSVCSTNSPLKYRCPRCLCQLCSKDCYAGHGGDCTEQFYRDRVKSVLSYEGKGQDDADNNNRSSDDDTEYKLSDIATKLVESHMNTAILRDDEFELLQRAMEKFDISQCNSSIDNKQWWELSDGVLGDNDRSPDLLAEDLDTDKPIVSRMLNFNTKLFSEEIRFISFVLTDLSEALPPVSAALYLQVVALVLGYAVTMRSVGQSVKDPHTLHSYHIYTRK